MVDLTSEFKKRQKKLKAELDDAYLRLVGEPFRVNARDYIRELNRTQEKASSQTDNTGGKTEANGGAQEKASNHTDNTGGKMEAKGGDDLELARKLTEQGSLFDGEKKYIQAVDCFRRALDLRLYFFGGESFECISSFYNYGYTLLKLSKSEEQSKDQRLDMSLKALGVALDLSNSHFENTMENGNIRLAFAEASMLTKNFAVASCNYKAAFSIYEGLVEYDTQLLAGMYFDTAVSIQKYNGPVYCSRLYCERAKSICEAKLEKIADSASRDNLIHGFMKEVQNLLIILDLEEEDEEGRQEEV